MTATNTSLASEPAHQDETEIERNARLARESAMLDEARDDVRLGRVVADKDVDGWLDLFVSGESLPIPDAPSPLRAG
jgi:hypothetical protein